MVQGESLCAHMRYLTISEKQTFNLAKQIAKEFKSKKIIGLIGELGTGKTIFVKGLAAGLGIKKNITSPTFVLMRVYKIANRKSQIANFVHIDAYRIKSAKDLLAIGVEEYFKRPDTITVIEWADKIKEILPKETRYVKIKYQGGNKRIINS